MDAPTCRRCQGHGPFYKSYTDHHNYVCKACASTLVAESRTQDPARLLAYRWYNALRRRGVQSRQQADTVRAILNQWGTASVIGGERDVAELCIMPFYRDAPLLQEPWNCVVVSRHEARVISHTRSETRAHELFPPHIRQHMAQARLAAAPTASAAG